MRVHFVAWHARFQRPDRQARIFAELGIRHHQAVIRVPENEGFRNILDCLTNAHVGFGGLLREAMLLTDIEGDADQMKVALAGDFGANTHPDP
ncbi:Uncharacterised protein [Brucella melitensis]|nr:Uncharacterised protein [Brucella melitensis]